jgi:molecular chaperone HtpG
LETIVPKQTYTVQLEAMDSLAAPFIITQPEFMRRMKEMNQSGGGGMFGMGNMPDVQSSSKYKFTTSHYYSKY